MLEFRTIRLLAAIPRRGLVRAVARFRGRKEGAAAVEFALVAMPFLALLFAIMETAFVFFAGQTLEAAVADSARLIMTGQAQKQGFNQAAFKNAVCGKIYALFDCQGGVYVDVKTYTNFNDVTMSSPIDSKGKLIKNFTYQPGGASEIVVVRLFYQWPIYLSVLGNNLENMADNKRLLIATAAFRNEPYDH
jgi:Flp pilus assembly protein TadG